MNNRGQSLVLFVIIVPMVIFILFMIYDIGNMVLLKEKLDNINYLVIDYGLDYVGDSNIQNKLSELINKNKNDIDNVNIIIEDNVVKISLEDKLDNNISLLKNFDVFSKYIGYMEGNKKIIRKDK